jgi:hypothetical protein
MGSYMEIFEARVLREDNDNYKPHAKNYSNLSMFTEVIAKTRHNSQYW